MYILDIVGVPSCAIGVLGLAEFGVSHRKICLELGPCFLYCRTTLPDFTIIGEHPRLLYGTERCADDLGCGEGCVAGCGELYAIFDAFIQSLDGEVNIIRCFHSLFVENKEVT